MERSRFLLCCSSKYPKEYDVFLSFRGEDTRNNFTGFLHRFLIDKGIRTFLDDGLERGKDISQLFEIIENSNCCIIVLSRNYANSTWCLTELVKILDCKNTMELTVLPIFFLVEPTHVRNKTGSFGEAFIKYKQDFRDQKEKAQMTENGRQNMEKELKRWDDALTEVSTISGWTLSERDNQAKFLDDFVLKVSTEYVVSPNISEDLFGMSLHIEKLSSYVDKSESSVHFVGICGMGGIGKTTIARAFYNMKSFQFEGSSFLANVKDVYKDKTDGLLSLQKQLLSETLNGEFKNIWDVQTAMKTIRSRLCHKKVLVIIDDVDSTVQLKNLAGKLDWFGSGSIIIFTTRDESLLVKHQVRKLYRVELLHDGEALKLFSWNAFQNVCPRDEYTNLSKQVIAYARGLPLALEVLGSFLCDKTVDEWKDQLKRLGKSPPKEITDVLQISYDGLEEMDKNIFLFIVCFFNGDEKDYVINILDRCDFNPKIGIRNLTDKSLLSIVDDILWIHDLLKEMGWNIVRETSLSKVGKQLRLWNVTNISQILKNNVAIEEVVAVVCSNLSETSTEETERCFEVFSKMKNLRLLKLSGSVLLPKFPYLSNQLLILEWNKCPFEYFPSSFPPAELVKLDMSNSSIIQLSDNMKPLPNLRFLSLSGCINLTRISKDFTVVPNLEVLDVSDCSKLLELDQSFHVLRKLTLLNLSNCSSLLALPPNMAASESMVSLRSLNCSGCTNFQSFSDKICSGETAIEQVLSSSSAFRSLVKLDLSCIHLYNNVLEVLGCLPCLEELYLSYNNLASLRASISKLSELKFLNLEHCIGLRSLTELPSSLLARQGNERTIFTSLKRYPQLQNADPNTSQRFDIVLPGNEIPNWFVHQNMGSSISIELNPNWCNSEWMGFALCLCFKMPEHFAFAVCNVKLNGQDWGHGQVKFPGWVSNIYIKKDYLWHLYLPRHTYFSIKWEKSCSNQIIEFSFEGWSTSGDPLEVKMCGACLVYQQDVQEFNSRMQTHVLHFF